MHVEMHQKYRCPIVKKWRQWWREALIRNSDWEILTPETSVVSGTMKLSVQNWQRNGEATLYVKEMDLFVTVKLLEDTPAFLSLRKLCLDHWYSHEWTTGQKPQLIKGGRRKNKVQHRELPTNRCPWFIDKLFKLSSTFPTSVLQETVVPTLHPASTRSDSTSCTQYG